ncbi:MULTISPECIES: hypothetical protein [unclassified Microbacterium]|uniref:hypothetical protein n=1 Tax=unclassified Microbacterium TaxID=2609290 RepID=UPI003016C671
MTTITREYLASTDGIILAVELDLEPHGCRSGRIDLAPTAPRIRVERCIADAGPGWITYAPGWLVIYGDAGGDWCHHDEWDTALACATDRARARALGLLGRW